MVLAPRCMRGPLPPGQILINTLGTHLLYFGNMRVNLRYMYVYVYTQVPSPDESIMMKILVTRVTHHQYTGVAEYVRAHNILAQSAQLHILHNNVLRCEPAGPDNITLGTGHTPETGQTREGVWVVCPAYGGQGYVGSGGREQSRLFECHYLYQWDLVGSVERGEGKNPSAENSGLAHF